MSAFVLISKIRTFARQGPRDLQTKIIVIRVCDRYFFSGDVRAPRTCAKRIFRIRGDGKVYRGVYLRLYKSCTKMFILAASTGWEAHRRRTAVFISRENAVFGPKKID